MQRKIILYGSCILVVEKANFVEVKVSKEGEDSPLPFFLSFFNR